METMTNPNSLQDEIKKILIDSTKGISTYEPRMKNIIINLPEATTAILELIEARLPKEKKYKGDLNDSFYRNNGTDIKEVEIHNKIIKDIKSSLGVE